MGGYLGWGAGGKEPLMSFYHDPLTLGLLGDRGVIDRESAGRDLGWRHVEHQPDR